MTDTRPRSDLAAASDLLCKYIDQTAEQAATIATLRAALDGLIAAGEPIVDMHPAVDIVTGLREQVVILRAALVAAREVTP